MRNILLGLMAGTLGALLASPLVAADMALPQVVGYSDNGRYFAFEEFGVQDGSGFPYSTYYVIDLKTDRWVVGSPIHERGDDEAQTLDDIRKQAWESAQPLIENLQIMHPAQMAAAIGDGVPNNDGKTLVFGLPVQRVDPEVVGEYTLELETMVVPAGAPCQEWFDEDPKGYALSISDHASAREVHRDLTLPRSRQCPKDYRLWAVYLPFQATDISSAVALISVYTYGFEGRDRRFVALPLGATGSF